MRYKNIDSIILKITLINTLITLKLVNTIKNTLTLITLTLITLTIINSIKSNNSIMQFRINNKIFKI